MEDTIYNLLTKQDEVTWQSIIYELIKTDELDPWNIDISKLLKRYLEAIKSLKEHNFFISGKVILASSILLKIKSDKLLNEYIADFDSQLFPPEEELLEAAEEDYKDLMRQEGAPPLLLKTPQSRKKQITLNDLMGALEKALEVDERRRIKRLYELPVIAEAVLPEKPINITDLIQNLYYRIVNIFSKKEQLLFTDLLESDSKQDKINTFIPLLHLTNQQKVDLEQNKPFGDIRISLLDEEETE